MIRSGLLLSAAVAVLALWAALYIVAPLACEASHGDRGAWLALGALAGAWCLAWNLYARRS